MPKKQFHNSQVVPVQLDSVQEISAVRIQLPEEVTTMQSRKQTRRIVEVALERFKGGLPLLDPVKDMKIKGDEIEVLDRCVY